MAAIGLVRRDHDAAAPTDLHADDPLVPALDDLTAAQPELERVATVPAGVELLAGSPRDTDVVHLDLRTGGGLVAAADLDVLRDQVGRRCLAGRYVHVRLLVRHGSDRTAAAG